MRNEVIHNVIRVENLNETVADDRPGWRVAVGNVTAILPITNPQTIKRAVERMMMIPMFKHILIVS